MVWVQGFLGLTCFMAVLLVIVIRSLWTKYDGRPQGMVAVLNVKSVVNVVVAIK